MKDISGTAALEKHGEKVHRSKALYMTRVKTHCDGMQAKELPKWELPHFGSGRVTSGCGKIGQACANPRLGS